MKEARLIEHLRAIGDTLTVIANKLGVDPIKAKPAGKAPESGKAILITEILYDLYKEDFKSFTTNEEIKTEVEKVIKAKLTRGDVVWVSRTLATTFSKGVKKIDNKTQRGFYIKKKD